MILSEAATVDKEGQSGTMVIMINDVARAFFEAAATRAICVEIPEEAKDDEDEEEDNVAILRKSLYGTRDAAANFQKEIRKFMSRLGFETGRYNVSTFYHKSRNMMTMVHGDDFVTACGREDAKWFRKALEERFEIKTKVLGDGKDESREETVLNRVVRRTSEGWEYEADSRHAEIIVKAMNMENANPVVTPGEEEKEWKVQEEAVELPKEQITEYRALAARSNYLATDRVDIQFAVKEICRGMAKPTVGDKRKLKRLARYLVGKPRVVTTYPWQERSQGVWGFSDSDWAGCKKTARSTSGGMIMKGRHFLKAWSSTQKSVTLSSAEAELVAAVKTCTELIGITQLAHDWGQTWKGEVFVDSSAAIGIAYRRGHGRLRHVKVGTLWIQEKTERGELAIQKIPGESNPADVLTKNVGREKLEKFTDMVGQKFQEGKAEKSLDIAGWD